MSLSIAEHYGIDPKAYSRRWWILAVLCLSLVIVVVGNTSLNVAIPVLASSLGASNSQLQWIVDGYSLVFAGLLLTAGALGDRFGRKRALQGGLFMFLLGSLVGVLAGGANQLIAARAIMGIGAAFVMPSTLSLLANVFPPHERQKAIAIWASLAGAAGTLGPVASGLLLQHFWWGSVLFVNVPIIITAIVAGRLLLPESRDPEQEPPDPLGALLSILGLSSLVYSLIEAPEKGWLSGSTFAVGAFSAVMIAGFVAWELHTPHPMLEIRYFGNRALAIAASGMVLIFTGLYGVFFLLTQYYQLVLGYSPLGAAVRLLPTGLVILAVAPNTPRLLARFGNHRVVALGMLLLGVTDLLLSRLTLGTPFLAIIGILALNSAGIGLASAPLTASVMSAIPPRRAGMGSAINDATRELGACLGVAVMGSVAASRYLHHLGGALKGLSAADRNLALSSLSEALQVARRIGGPGGTQVGDAARQSYVDGLHSATLMAAVASLAASVIILKFLPRQTTHQSARAGEHTRAMVESAELTEELAVAGVMPITEADLDHVVSEPFKP
ncbi:MAG: drug resistance transporter, EmrB/QacA subfamily [Acidimicrobiia bacterium]|nr:drug resistance transporter, EmrB/QacA subfamily [Acidimicrobiia bacterium]